MIEQRRGPLAAGDQVQLTDPKGRRHLVVLEPGKSFHTHRGSLSHDDLIGGPDGSVVTSSGGTPYVALRPLLADFTLAMKRGAAVVYPKDAAQIIAMADVFPGARVIEAGAGSGALTCWLLRAVGEGGRVVSYERRADFAAIARGNVGRFFGEEHPAWTLVEGDFGGPGAEPGDGDGTQPGPGQAAGPGAAGAPGEAAGPGAAAGPREAAGPRAARVPGEAAGPGTAAGPGEAAETGAAAGPAEAEGPAAAEADRVILDMLAPWDCLGAAAGALTPGGVICCYVATTTQLSRTAEALRAQRAFDEPTAWETLVRGWHVDGLAVRPEQRMVGHTGFLVTARRLAEGVTPPPRRRRPAKGAHPDGDTGEAGLSSRRGNVAGNV